MTIDYTVHPLGPAVSGNLAPAPMIPHGPSQAALADDTNSAAITIGYAGQLAIVSTAKVRLDIEQVAANLNPGLSAIVLQANETRFFTLPAGTWYLKSTAFV